jgi:D-galactarolactone cycloisomerase
MKITAIEDIHLHYPYPQADRFRYGGGLCTGRLTCIVRVHTDAGITGIGSCYSHPGLLHQIIAGQLAPILIGTDPCDIAARWQQMNDMTLWYGRKGVALTAIGGIDIALWDIIGKSTGQPVRKLLNPDALDASPVYASALLWNEDLDALAEEARRHVDKGFRRIKMRLGMGEAHDCAAVRAVRNAVGSDTDIMVDAGMRLHVELALRMSKVLEECRVFWFEEPFRPDDLDSYVALRKRISVPLAAGENEFGSSGFRELIRARAVDIVQFDVARAGGISEANTVAEMAADADMRVAPHTWNDAVAINANAQIVAAYNGLTVEMDQTGNPFIEDLAEPRLAVTNGRLELSLGNGLGLGLKEDLLDRYQLPNPPDVPEGRYSDMVFGGAAFYTPAGPYSEIQ